jgi:hypothetical protein
MDFSYIGGSSWGTDQFSPTTVSGVPAEQLFITQPNINNHLSWPVQRHTFPVPAQKKQPVQQAPATPKKQSIVEQFANSEAISDDTLIIVMLAILIIICVCIYTNVRQSAENIKLLVTLLTAHDRR